MAKRTIYECDLTKQEFDPDEAVVLTFKKKGKRQGSSFELSQEAAERLLSQLNGSRELPEDWDFQAGSAVATQKVSDLSPVEQFEEGNFHYTPDQRRESFNQEMDDAELHALEQKRLQRRVQARENLETEPQVIGPPTVKPSGNDCPHMNRTPVKLTMRNKKRYAYRICKECGVELPEQKIQDRERLKNIKAPSGSRIEANERTRKQNT